MDDTLVILRTNTKFIFENFEVVLGHRSIDSLCCTLKILMCSKRSGDMIPHVASKGLQKGLQEDAIHLKWKITLQ